MSPATSQPDHRAQIDRDRCLGTGSCEHLDPERFELDAFGIARWRDGAAPADPDRLLTIAGLCPQGAISVVDENGVEVE